MFCLQSKYLDNKVNCRVQTIYRKFRHFKVEEFVGKKYLQTFSMSFPALYYVCMYIWSCSTTLQGLLYVVHNGTKVFLCNARIIILMCTKGQ